MEPTLRQLNVKTTTGEVRSFSVGAHIPVLELKSKIQESFNVPIDRQRLISQGKLLKDEHLISEYIKEDGITIHLMIKADVPPDPQPRPPQSSVPPPQPTGMPVQLEQMLSSMMGGAFPGAQILSQFLPPNLQRPPQPNPAPPSNPAPSSNPPASNPQPNIPRGPVEFSLPFDHVQNIGGIVNEFYGHGASFPPPRMPQLPLPRNPLSLLGGFLYNYQFQLSRLLPFISRAADLMQRESLLQDPQERHMLQEMVQRIGNALVELQLSTAPVSTALQQIHIGPAPGQFQLRFGNLQVAPDVRPEPVPVQVPLLIPSAQVPLGNPPAQAPLVNMPPAQGMPINLGAMMGGQGNMLGSMMPMLTQMLGGNQGMTLRELVNSLQMHDEEESLPMMDFFYNLNISQIVNLASGNWDAIEAQRPAVRESLIKLMDGDSPEGRLRIVQILIDYIQRQYAVPSQFTSMLATGFSPIDSINRIGHNWLLRLVNLVMDYQGSSFVSEFRQNLEMLVGNYAEEMGRNLQGGMNNVMNMIQAQMQTALARIIPPEFTVMLGGVMGGVVLAYVSRAVATYSQWKESQRTQEEAKEAPQSPAAALLAQWQSDIERDFNADVPAQRPFSRSYIESDVFSQPRGVTNVQELFFRSLQAAFGDAGVQPVPTSAPAEVIQEFFSQVVAATRDRIRSDQDFRSGRFEFLDKIQK